MPRVGVYVCHCGGNISDTVDIRKVVDAAKAEPDVVWARDVTFACADSSQKEMIEDVKAQKLDRIVVASCSPKLHELTFRGVVERAGLNPYQYYHANIREQASWAHSDDHEGATAKAIRHVRAAVAYARLAEPLSRTQAEFTPKVLVIGGGVAGLKASIDLSSMGVGVVLLEKSPSLGGRTAELPSVYPYGRSGGEVVQGLLDELHRNDGVTTFTNAILERVTGHVGSFQATFVVTPAELASHEAGPAQITVTVGAILVATGADTYVPKAGEYGYGRLANVVTLPEFLRLKEQSEPGDLRIHGKRARRLAFIYCVGSRQAPIDGGSANEYCSRYCCNATVSTTLSILGDNPDLAVYHLYRDMRTYGKNELIYEDASRKGVVFIRFNGEESPTVAEAGGGLVVSVKDQLIDGELVEIPVDLVVLVTGLVPRENKDLEGILKLPLGKDGFYQEVHPKLRPVETNISGLYIGGTAQGPKDLGEAVESGSAMAAKAAASALRGELELEPFVATVDAGRCNISQMCVSACPYGAIEIREVDGVRRTAVDATRCKGCGACVAVCPTEAIQLKGFSNDQIRSMIAALGRGT
jgi:heterodisulfide reductase subunit A